ncbi:hypothetical protein [Cysteiniphilum sp. 6C5]|uniref:hypothetical protein n=1 Tax=unclassified Cysteiniphilum TaxID=2610889 RepID=UPI003F87CB97
MEIIELFTVVQKWVVNIYTAHKPFYSIFVIEFCALLGDAILPIVPAIACSSITQKHQKLLRHLTPQNDLRAV